jgi:hypothetical protein
MDFTPLMDSILELNVVLPIAQVFIVLELSMLTQNHIIISIALQKYQQFDEYCLKKEI